MVKQFSAIYEGKNEVKFLGGLERELQRHNKGVVDLSENGSFGESVGNFGS